MMFKFFIHLCTKIIKPAIVVGLYYGFLTVLSIGPSYLFLLQARIMEEERNKQLATTTGFLMGQLIMFISIYYAPLHLTLDRAHTLTAMGVPYILLNFFWNNHKKFVDYESTNSMREFGLLCVFLNSFIFQFLNYFVLPSSMLARSVNIYMFRCNNKMLFVTSSFFGWVIGQFIFMKCLGLVLVWIQQFFYRYLLGRINMQIRANKYLKSEFRYSVARLFKIILFISCLYNFGRMPIPLFTPKMFYQIGKSKQSLVKEDGTDDEEKEKMEKKKDIEESYLININANENFKLKNNESIFKKYEKSFFIFFFDTKRWNRPIYYIEGGVRNEMSQYFFNICKSDGKERISFTYLPSLSFFIEMIKRKISPILTVENFSTNKFYNPWLYTNEQKAKSLNNEFINRIEAIDKNFFSLNMLETKTRLCNDDDTKEYLLKSYDPLLNGSFRKKTYKIFLLSTLRLEKIPLENLIENFGINRIHGIFLLPLNTDYQEFNINKQKISISDKKPLSTEIIEFLTLISRLIIKWGSVDLNEYLIWKTIFLSKEGRKIQKNIKNLVTQIETDINDQKIIKKYTKIKEIRKKVLRWSYKLKEEFDDILSHLYIPKEPGEFEILSSEYKSLLMWSTNKLDSNNLKDKDKDPNEESKIEKHYVLRYGIESDFQRHYIMGSVRAQRRKVAFFKLFQTKVHSPLFLDRLKNFLYRIKRIFYLIKDDISFLIKLIFRIINRAGNKEKFKSLAYIEKQTKKTKKEAKQNKWEKEEIERLKIAANWDMIPHGMEIRGLLLLFQSFFRKRILLPLLIIVKNIGRILLFQPSELHEDFKELDKEIYVNCTYEGIPLSEKDFPEDWFAGGFQIKILSPFRLKPWNKLKLESNNKEIGFSFLTVWGMETKYPFGSPRKIPPFFKPIFIELKKKILTKKYFKILIVFKKKTKLLFKKIIKWIIKNIILIKKKIKELSKVNPISRLRKITINESREFKKEKDSNQHESANQIISPSNIKYSLIEKRIIYLTDRTKTILNKIESTNKTNAKRSEKRQILKRRNIRIIFKLPIFLKVFIEKIYICIFLSRINIPKTNIKYFLKLIKKIIRIYNIIIYDTDINRKKQEIIKKKNKIQFISRSLDINSKNSSNNFYNFAYISQAYVFYKLSQIQVSNSYKLRSILNYHEFPLFIKTKIKNFFEKRGMVYSKLGNNKLSNYEKNKWKFWLRRHSQFNLSHIKWSILIPEKWRHTVYLNTRHSYEKNQLTEFDICSLLLLSNEEEYSLDNQKDNLKKNYRYDLVSYKFINYENKTKCFFYRFPFQGNNNQDILYTLKESPFYMPINILLKKYLNNNNIERTTTLYIKKRTDRKYCDCMKMNETMLKNSISNMESCLFPELVLLYNAYKIEPWFIPSKLLLLNFNKNHKNISETKQIDEKKKNFITLQKKDQNKKEKESKIQGNYVRSNIKYKKKRNPNSYAYMFSKHDTLFQIKINNTFKQKLYENLEAYCFMNKSINLAKSFPALITKKGINLRLLIMPEDLITNNFVERGLLSFEAIPLPIKKDGQFIMYQTIGVSLINKSKNQTNQKYQNQITVENRDTKSFNLLIPENILSFRHRRKFRILSCFNSKNINYIDRNIIFENKKNIKNNTKISHDSKDFSSKIDDDKNQLLKLKLFLWPYYRLEDLACMNRYWFDINNGSRFNMLRVHLYPRLKSFNNIKTLFSK